MIAYWDPAVVGRRDTSENPLERQFEVVIDRDEDGYYVASVPQIPGCHPQARCLDEVMHRISEAAELCLEGEGMGGTYRQPSDYTQP
jgi:predicted RNase H-like HicB family nuclease